MPRRRVEKTTVAGVEKKNAPGRPMGFGNFSDIGFSGLNYTGGIVREEFLPELKGKKGINLYKEMRDNDPIVGAVLFAVKMLMRQAEWRVKPHPDDKAESSPAVELVQQAKDDMSSTWEDVITEVLSMMVFGWAWLEVVYKKRNGPSRDPANSSRYNDGKIGWRKMPLRAQETWRQWQFDSSGGVQGMEQRTFQGQFATIPIVKSLLFRTESTKNNPEGRSVLRNIYRPWYFKKRIEEVEGVGIERDLAGLPIITPPEGVDIWNRDDPVAVEALRQAEVIVRSIRRDEQEGVVLPFGWTLELLSTGGRRSFDTSAIIDRYNNLIAMTMLADFIVLGHNNRYGSFALSSSKTHMFGVAVGGWMNSIAAVFNRYAIPRLLELNGMPLENPPILDPGDIEMPDLNELGTYILRLSQAGFQIFPNTPIEEKLLHVASMPTQGIELGREPPPPPAPFGGGDPNNPDQTGGGSDGSSSDGPGPATPKSGPNSGGRKGGTGRAAEQPKR